MQIINPEDVKLKLLIDEENIDEEVLTYKIYLDKNFDSRNIENEIKNDKSLNQIVSKLFHQGFQPNMKDTWILKDGFNEGWIKSRVKDNRLYWLSSSSKINAKNPLNEREILLYQLETKENSDRTNTRGGVSSNKKYTPSKREDWIELNYEKYLDGMTFKEQLNFAKNRKNPFMHIQGPAGSGKTTALAKRVNFNKNRKLMWLTFNELLKNEAVKNFEDKVEEKNLIVKDFVEFYNDLSPEELSITLNPYNAISEFKKVILENYYGDGTKDKNPKEWEGKEEFIYSEIHGKIIGRTGPIDLEGFPTNIDSKFYIPGFDAKKLKYQVDNILNHKNLSDVDTLSKNIFKTMNEKLDFEKIKDLFPGPINALLLLEHYEKKLPEIFNDLQEILIDECQDLSYIEVLLICNFRSRLQNQLKKKVVLRTAGDERQSVRPTFYTKDMMSEIFYGFEEKNKKSSVDINLNGNKRSPKSVVDLINCLDDSRNVYPTQQKIRTQQFNYEEVDDKNSTVAFYQVKSKNEFTNIIGKFDLDKEFQLIYPRYFVDDTYFTKKYTKYATKKILPTGIIKGKEYDLVGIVNASQVIEHLNALKKVSKPASNVLAQLMINSFYVSLSRSKDKVIFIEELENKNPFKVISSFFDENNKKNNSININEINFETLQVYFDEEDFLEKKFHNFLSECKNYLDSEDLELALNRFESIEEIIKEIKNTRDDVEIFTDGCEKIGYSLFLKILIKKLDDKKIRNNYRATKEYKKLKNFADSLNLIDSIINFHILRYKPLKSELEKCFNSNIELQLESLQVIKQYDKNNESEIVSSFYDSCVSSITIFYERLKPNFKDINLKSFNNQFIKETLERISYARDILIGYEVYEAGGLTSLTIDFPFEYKNYRENIYNSLVEYGDFLYENSNWSEASAFYESLEPYESKQLYLKNKSTDSSLNIYSKRMKALENSRNKDKFDVIISLFEKEIKSDKELIKEVNTNPELITEVINAARSKANFEFLQDVKKGFSLKGPLKKEVDELVDIYNLSNSMKSTLNKEERSVINNLLKN
jgi:hypothetical protein